MKTKIKVIALLLCLVLVVSTAAGCASFAKFKDKLAPDDYSVYIKSDDDSASEYDVNTDIDKFKSSSSSSDSDITIEEQVVFDKEGIKITALSYEVKSFGSGDEISILVENNSDIDVKVSSYAGIVNGFSKSEVYFSAKVAAGEKTYDSIPIYLNKYEKECIGAPGKIELYFSAMDDNYDYVLNDEYFRIITSAYTGKDAEMNLSGKELVNSNGVKIDFIGSGEYNYITGKGIYFYVENNTDDEIVLLSEDVSVNGIMIENTMIYAGFLANTKGIVCLPFTESELESGNIDSIDKVELKFVAKSMERYDDILSTGTITINPNK